MVTCDMHIKFELNRMYRLDASITCTHAYTRIHTHNRDDQVKYLKMKMSLQIELLPRTVS